MARSPILDATPDDVADRLFQRALERRPYDSRALRAYLKAMRFLGLAFGQQLAGLRSSDDRVERALADAHSSKILAYVLREAVEILGARIDKLPPRQRPHFTPAQRFRILELVHLAGLTREEAATLFHVSVTTLSDWQRNANPAAKTVGSTLKPQPPIRRYGDPTRHLVQVMARLGFHGYRTIAGQLALAGWRVARSTVRRVLKEPPVPDPSRPATTAKQAVVARFVHHVWHVDLTVVPGFLGTTSRQLAVILDGFSRIPVAAAVFLGQPSADQMTAFIEVALARHGKPRHIIVDQASYFTALDFQERIKAWRVNLRFCSADNHRANARIERFWGTLKNALLDLRAPVSLRAEVEQVAEIDRALRYYVSHRPHSALGGATPGEILAGAEPRHLRAVQPPRGRPGDPGPACPVVADYFEGDPRLPLLRAA